jgi:hypothetical protein
MPAMLREHGVIAVILLMGFLMRLFLSGTNSYWYDEVLSVVTFGIDNGTGADALETICMRCSLPSIRSFCTTGWRCSEIAKSSRARFRTSASPAPLHLDAETLRASRGQERRGKFNIEKLAEKIDNHDHLVLAFPHHTTKRFPKLLAALSERYTVRFSMLNDGHGFIVYSVHQ